MISEKEIDGTVDIIRIERSEKENVILPFEKKGEFFVESVENLPEKRFYDFIKRVFDLVFSLFGLVVLCIPLLVIAVIVKITSPGPAFYKQSRLGKNGKTFQMIKFRTMRNDAEKDGAQWSQGDDDPRITKTGAILRKTRLDELPQLWCILKGDMSVVGPRPEREIFYNEFETYIHGFRQRLNVKPGLTGLAQVNGGYDLRPEEKIIYDIEYIKTRSFFCDLKIIFETVKVVFTHDGAK